jgi:hypothetical protein
MAGSFYPATAMAPLRRRRFLECDDLEANRAEEENVIKEYGQQPWATVPILHQKPRSGVEGLIREWRE